jgi:hypothetical protein
MTVRRTFLARHSASRAVSLHSPRPFPALAGEKRGRTGAIPVAAVPVGAVRLQLDVYGNMGICFPV